MDNKQKKRIVLASGNKHKIAEIAAMLPDYEIVGYKDFFDCEIEETGNTFEDNSYLKAKALFDFCKKPSLADDSGLMVEALGGAPGVFSARYSGEGHTDAANRAKLLRELEGKSDRRAKFVCVITLIDENGNVFRGYGETHGEILSKECGDNGFGYDSLFFSYDLKKSFGEATAEEKNEVSHRSRALADLTKKLWYYKV